jgi:hypothetical protein
METQRRLPDPEIEPWLSIPAAGAIFGLGRAASYEAARRGDLPTIRLAGRRRVPTARLRVLLGLSTEPDAS